MTPPKTVGMPGLGTWLRRAGRRVTRSMQPATQQATPADAREWPTVCHVTHWKAGSQWLHKILQQCAPERYVAPRSGMVQFLQGPVQPGEIYPTLYLTREAFESVALPPGSRRFVVIRDLRDTLVSWYYSVKISHVDDDPALAGYRAALNARNLEDGLLWSLGHPHFVACAAIQQSWKDLDTGLVRYEDLLVRDEEELKRVLLGECGLPVAAERLRAIVRANRFEILTGRQRGQEEIRAHERKGIAGDWRNHFTDRVKRAFKDRYGPLLVATGYASDLDW